MARQSVWALAALVVLGTAGVQGYTPPQADPPKPQQQRSEPREGRRGPWWKAPHPVAAELAISPDQSAAIDKIFWAYVEKSKPLRAELNDLERALDRVMHANLAEISVVEQESARIEAKRAELMTMRTVMLYSVRRVLKPDQIEKYDRIEAARKKQDAERRR